MQQGKNRNQVSREGNSVSGRRWSKWRMHLRIVSQHSWLWWDGEQGMDWQHFMASAGVVVPEQSKT